MNTQEEVTAGARRYISEELAGRMFERQALEAVIWGMPAVNFELLVQGHVDCGGGWNQIVYWSRLPDWKNQTLTPNPGTIYLHAFYNTQDVGPVVLEIPPADDGTITGSIDDAWQTALEDVGPAGVDKGKGGKYLLLPPGYRGDVPDGYIVLPSSTYAGFALLRSNLRSDSEADIASAVAYGMRVRLYPLSQASAPPPTTFVDAIDKLYDSKIVYDVRFFELLDRFVQRELWLERDRAMIDPLRSIGIAKGTTFRPDAASTERLNAAIAEARAWLDAKYEALFTNPFTSGTHWALPASNALVEALTTNFGSSDSYPIDARGTAYSFAFFSAKHLGTGQYYLMTIQDKNGNPLDGAERYRLHVPAGAPVNLYWSATVYDRSTHTFIEGATVLQRSSLEASLQTNADGSVDIWFAPSAPAGKESNWVPTKVGATFEVLFRLYGPEKAFFDKAWVLPDIEKTR